MSIFASKKTKSGRAKTQIRAQDDFYGSGLEQWLVSNPEQDCIPTGPANLLRGEIYSQTRAIVADWLAADYKDLSHDQKLVVDFYRLRLDRNKSAVKSLRALIEIVDRCHRLWQEKGFAGLAGKLSALGIDIGIVTIADIDMRDNRRHCLTVVGRGYTLPSKDYYSGHNQELQEIARQYKDFISSYSQKISREAESVAGLNLETIDSSFISTASKRGDHLSHLVWSAEKALAAADWPVADKRDDSKTYRFYSRTQLAVEFDFDWDSYFEEAAVSGPVSDVFVFIPEALRARLEVFCRLPGRDLWAYCCWRLLLGFAREINDDLEAEYDQFFGASLRALIRPTRPLRALSGLLMNVCRMLSAGNTLAVITGAGIMKRRRQSRRQQSQASGI